MPNVECSPLRLENGRGQRSPCESVRRWRRGEELRAGAGFCYRSGIYRTAFTCDLQCHTECKFNWNGAIKDAASRWCHCFTTLMLSNWCTAMCSRCSHCWGYFCSICWVSITLFLCAFLESEYCIRKGLWRPQKILYFAFFYTLAWGTYLTCAIKMAQVKLGHGNAFAE